MREGGRERGGGSQICTITEEAQIAAECPINVASVGGAPSDYCVKLLHTSFSLWPAAEEKTNTERVDCGKNRSRVKTDSSFIFKLHLTRSLVLFNLQFLIVCVLSLSRCYWCDDLPQSVIAF